MKLKLSLPLMFAATGLAVMHGAIAADLSEDDQKFLRKAGESGMLEIQASELAMQKAQHPEVKRYAEMMIKDHKAVDQELKTLAQGKGFKLPVELEKDKADLMEELRQLEGVDFDEEYAEEVAVDAHEDAVELFEDAAEDADDAEIKAFAAKHLPALQNHLEMGRQLDDLLDESDDKRRARATANDGTRANQEGSVVVPGTAAQPAAR